MSTKAILIILVSILILIVLGAIVIFGVAPFVIKNGLIAKDEAVNEAWSQIDIQLQRRMDLIPNLVNTVKGYAKHEKEVFESISNARSKLLAAKTPSQKAGANSMVEQSLGRLLAIVENYPTLKADKSFIRLQDELAGTENRITVARSRYNTAVKIYNAAIRKFPGNLFASGMDLNKREYFNVPDDLREKASKAPEVNFN